ncbi:MAG: CoA-binding protein [Halocynthiibacter sp.]
MGYAEALEGVKTIAVVGASPRANRPSYGVMEYLINAGFDVIPINPGHAGRKILGQAVYASLSDSPKHVDMVNVFRQSKYVPEIVQEAMETFPELKSIWLQLDVMDDASAQVAEAKQIAFVQDACVKIEHRDLAKA